MTDDTSPRDTDAPEPPFRPELMIGEEDLYLDEEPPTTPPAPEPCP